jgi:hypothetical protein
MKRRSRWKWTGRVVAVVAIAGLATYLSSVGLDKVSKITSILGLLVAIAALVAPYLMPPSADGDSPHGASQRVANTVVHGNLTQVYGSLEAQQRHGQLVSDTKVGGDLTQADGTDNDISGR